ncbi:MAG: hypothetical protein H0W25_07150, partial [Acidimicrobiia bacterium]|nr:hypothetical protein [Acidimicrobiia bacterium]
MPKRRSRRGHPDVGVGRENGGIAVRRRPLEPPPITPLEAFERADEWQRAALLLALVMVPGAT